MIASLTSLSQCHKNQLTHVISGTQLSTADVLLVRHVICPQGEARVRDDWRDLTGEVLVACFIASLGAVLRYT